MVYNVFVAFTKAQLIHIKNVIDAENLSNYTLVSRFEVSDDLRKGASGIYVLKGSLSNIRRQLTACKQNLKSGGEVELYIAHSFNVFTQALIHELIENNKLKNLNIFPDGNLLFNNYSIKLLSKEHLIKKIVSFFLSTNYKLFSGNIIAPFAPINTVYTYLPEVVCTYKHLKLIHMPKLLERKNENNSKSLLILGHRNQKLISATQLLTVIKSNNHVSNVLYKPHPRLKLADDMFYRTLKSSFGSNMVLIDDNSPVESLVEYYPITHLFAVASSSLITLKILLPHLIVNYFGLEEYLGKHFDPLIKKQFDELGLIEWN
jgi:hypothetical protein